MFQILNSKQFVELGFRICNLFRIFRQSLFADPLRRSVSEASRQGGSAFGTKDFVLRISLN